MLRKIPNYEYRDNNKNTSDSSSGCEDDFDADDSYVNDCDEHESRKMDATAATLNLSPMPHFPPPPDYPPPTARTQTPQRSRYYYYENGKTDMSGSRRRVGSLDRDCGYTTDGNEICSQYRHNGSNPTSNSHSANNSFSSTSSSSNSSVVMHKMKMPQSQMRYPLQTNTSDFDSIEIFSTEQEKCFSHKTLTSLSKSSKNKMNHGGDAVRSDNSNQNINVVELFEQNLIPFGGSAASFAREAKLHTNAEPQVKWVRTNISATMERFHPSPSTSKHNNSTADHLYQQIDESPRSRYDFETNHPLGAAGPSKPPPPNSMRALMMTANRNAFKMSPTMRHMYTTRYGTQENIYEEISSEERLRLLSGGHSMMSLHQTSSVEEEFRRVQNRHRRILGELNLSVEAMLMPSTPPSESPIAQAETQESETTASTTRLNELLNVVGPTDELLSPVSINAANNNNTGDIDSGFSGSSSSGGASYLGSLRYKNGLPIRSSTPNGHSSASSCRSSQRSNEDPGILMISTRSSPLYGNGIINGSTHGAHTLAKANRFRSAEDPGPNATYKDGKVVVNGVATASRGGFWSRKSWRKLPGFSSNNSVNKAGLNNV
ncbi:uncharacterized protein LOC116346382 isoform X2 [Contarinia nasturtii]|uniref:uncharacterized protein LOC116346382 isoform X2 n=1 Tax=Contarinia nasturtii TaxID=265458 RepID=UPI0012D3D2A9|nr:uncharacterized protein LOC116346382 isoform X2 [Contarinia nasturtii]